MDWVEWVEDYAQSSPDAVWNCGSIVGRVRDNRLDKDQVEPEGMGPIDDVQMEEAAQKFELSFKQGSNL